MMAFHWWLCREFPRERRELFRRLLRQQTLDTYSRGSGNRAWRRQGGEIIYCGKPAGNPHHTAKPGVPGQPIRQSVTVKMACGCPIALKTLCPHGNSNEKANQVSESGVC